MATSWAVSVIDGNEQFELGVEWAMSRRLCWWNEQELIVQRVFAGKLLPWTLDTSPTLSGTWGMHLNHLLPLKPFKSCGVEWAGGYVGNEQAAMLVAYVILLSPQVPWLGFGLSDFGLGLDNNSLSISKVEWHDASVHNVKELLEPNSDATISRTINYLFNLMKIFCLI